MSESFITLADGTCIDPTTGRQVLPTTSIVSSDESTQLSRIDCPRRLLNELPDTPQRLAIINVVMVYHLFGLVDVDIAHLMNLSPKQVGTIIASPSFQRMLDFVAKSIRDHDIGNIRKQLQKYEEHAVDVLGELLREESPSIRISAAKDILDRGGHRPADIVEHRHQLSGGLMIEIVKRGGSDDVPVLVINGEVEEDGDSQGS